MYAPYKIHGPSIYSVDVDLYIFIVEFNEKWPQFLWQSKLCRIHAQQQQK